MRAACSQLPATAPPMLRRIYKSNMGGSPSACTTSTAAAGLPRASRMSVNLPSQRRTAPLAHGTGMLAEPPSKARRPSASVKVKPGGELQVHGSGALIRWLLANALVDEMTLLIVIVVVGQACCCSPPMARA
jgi:hypothetical protein